MIRLIIAVVLLTVFCAVYDENPINKFYKGLRKSEIGLFYFARPR